MVKYNSEIISFFKRYNLYEKNMFEYLEKHTDMIDYRMEDLRICIGCSYKINKNSNRIVGMRICIPFCYDEITTMISIHEIAHGIYGYKNLNKKYDELEIELLPMILERIYFEEKKTEKLTSYLEYLDSTIDGDSEEKYRFALMNRNESRFKDIKSYEFFSKNVKKLTRIWRRKNR